MTDHPIQEAWQTGSGPDIADASETYTPFVALSVDDITTRSLARTRVIHLIRDGYYDLFHYDPGNVNAEDGINVILDMDDRPFVRRPTGSGALIAHAAGTFAQRANYNSESSPRDDGGLFFYLSTDGNVSPISDPVLFAKLSDGNEWSDPILIRGPSGGDRYEIGNWDSDRPASGEELLSWIMTTTVTFAAGFTGSRAKARVAATSSAVYSIRKNDVQIGTITFPATSPTSPDGVFALASQTTFSAGDRLSIVAPDPRDATLSGVVVTLVGTR